MKWTDILKEEAGELLPLLDKLTLALQNRIREMEGFLRDSDEKDEADDLADDILRFSRRANGTGDMGKLFGLADDFRNLIKLIDEKYAKLVEMMR